MSNNAYTFIYIFLGILFSVCAIFNAYPFFSILSLVCMVGYLYIQLKDYSVIYIKYLYIVFIVVSMLTACTMIEFGDFYLQELRTRAKFNGSIPLLVLSFFFMLRTIAIADKKFTKKILVANNKFEKQEIACFRYLSIIALVVFSLCFIMVLPHPAFLLHLERADYASQYGLTGLFAKFATNIPRLIVFPCVLVVMGKGLDRRIGESCIIISALYYFWTGNKFGAVFTLLCLFLMVFTDYFVKKFGKETLEKVIYKIGVVVVLLICTTLFIQSITYNGLIKNYLSSRMAAEGQLWWSVFEHGNGGFNIGEITDELQMFELGNLDVKVNVGAHYGIYKMMYLSAPRSVVDAILSAGYRYAQSGLASAYYYLGFIGTTLYSVLMGLFYVFVANKITNSINKASAFRLFIYIRFWLYGTTAFDMFIFSAFFSPMSLLMIIYIIMTHKKSVSIKVGNSKIRA